MHPMQPFNELNVKVQHAQVVLNKINNNTVPQLSLGMMLPAANVNVLPCAAAMNESSANSNTDVSSTQVFTLKQVLCFDISGSVSFR